MVSRAKTFNWNPASKKYGAFIKKAVRPCGRVFAHIIVANRGDSESSGLSFQISSRFLVELRGSSILSSFVLCGCLRKTLRLLREACFSDEVKQIAKEFALFVLSSNSEEWFLR